MFFVCVLKKSCIFVLSIRHNNKNKNKMNTLKNITKKIDLINLVGLTFATCIIIPTLIFIITEIANGSFNNW